MKFIIFVYLFSIGLLVTHSTAESCGGRSTKTSQSQLGSTAITFNDSDRVPRIDKIIRIDLYKVNYFFVNVISRIDITYLKTDDTVETKEHGVGSPASLARTIVFDKGVYLTSIELRAAGAYLEWVNICNSNGDCSGRVGGSGAPTLTLSKSRSVIKSLLGNAGDVVNWIGANYETDGIYKAEVGAIKYKESLEPVVKVIGFQSPQASVTVDNFSSSTAQSASLVFAEEVTTSETYTFTNTQQFDTSLTITQSAGVDFKVFFAETSASFTVGYSFSNTLEKSKTKEIKKNISLTSEVVAPPYSRVTGNVFWRKVEYSYDWTGAVLCYFTFDPSEAVASGSTTGEISGSRAIFNGYLVLTQEFAPTAAPVSTAPVSAPVSTAPVSTAPVSTAPVSTAPVSTAPMSAAPVDLPVNAPIAAPASAPGVVPTCGLFGLNLFCPGTFCGFFGRLLGVCPFLD